MLIVEAVSCTTPTDGSVANPAADLAFRVVFCTVAAATFTRAGAAAGAAGRGTFFLDETFVTDGFFTADAFAFGADGLDAAACDLTGFADDAAFFTGAFFFTDAAARVLTVFAFGFTVFATGRGLDDFTFFTAIVDVLKIN